ncbi:MAG: adenylate kinase [Clostridia bacterium]|nr:adenylate kinase [Clostridia bacterium]
MKRVVVTGSPGSGKSVFSVRLHEKTGLPLIHLDNVWWKPDRTHVTREEFDAALADILKEDKWILDGSYSRTFEPRIAACDTVILLDYDTDLCMQGITERVGQVRPDIPWTEQTLDPELAELVKTYKQRNNPVLHELFRKYPDKDVHIFRTREEADRWLNGLQENRT